MVQLTGASFFSRFSVHEKEQLVLYDGSAQADAKLISVGPVLIRAVEVVEPVRRGKHRVSVVPKCRTTKLVGSRAGNHLYLTGTASGFRIDRAGRDANLFNEVLDVLKDVTNVFEGTADVLKDLANLFEEVADLFQELRR